MGYRQGPKIAGSYGGVIDDATRLRACAFVAALGSYGKAARRLRVSIDSIESACDRGHMKAQTAQRIREALDREEPLLAQRAAS